MEEFFTQLERRTINTVLHQKMIGIDPSRHRVRVTNAIVSLMVAAGAVAATTALASTLGVIPAADYALSKIYYQVRGTRPSKQQVVLVAFDQQAVQEWGPPPWEWNRIAPLLHTLQEARPRSLTLISGRRVIRDGTIPPSAEVPNDGEPAIMLGAPPLELVRWVDDTRAQSAAALALGKRLDPQALIVNFVGAHGLPVLPAARLASGQVPSSALTQRDILLGLTAPPYASTLPTSVGAMTEAEITAHAVSGVVDHQMWSSGGALRVIAAVLMFALGILALPRIRSLWGLAMGAALLLGLVVLDYELFATGVARMGAALPAFVMMASSLAAKVRERRALSAEAQDLGRVVRGRQALERIHGKPSGDAPTEDEAVYWERVGRLAQLYLDCASSFVAEVVGTQLKVRVASHTDFDRIAERRRDVRREPYRRAWMTQHSVWSPQFMAADLRYTTLLVPLLHRSQVMGFWLLNFSVDTQVSEAHMRLIDALGRQISRTMVSRWMRGQQQQLASWISWLEPGHLLAELQELGSDLRQSSGDTEAVVALVDSIPVGALVATLWGEIRYVNPAFAQAVAADEATIELGKMTLADLLAHLTPLSRDQVQLTMGQLVQELTEVQIRGRKSPNHPPLRYVLGWLSAAHGGGRDIEGEPLLLLCAVPSAEAAKPATAPGAAPASRAMLNATRPLAALSAGRVGFVSEEVTALKASDTIRGAIPPMPGFDPVAAPRPRPAGGAGGVPALRDQQAASAAPAPPGAVQSSIDPARSQSQPAVVAHRDVQRGDVDARRTSIFQRRTRE
jgi:GAF domain